MDYIVITCIGYKFGIRDCEDCPPQFKDGCSIQGVRYEDYIPDKTIYGDPMNLMEIVLPGNGVCECSYDIYEEIISQSLYPKFPCIIHSVCFDYPTYNGTIYHIYDEIRCPRCGTYHLVVQK